MHCDSHAPSFAPEFCSPRANRIAPVANWSQRLFSGLSAWPLTYTKRTLCVEDKATNSSHRSWFFTGFLSVLNHPRGPVLNPLFVKRIHQIATIGIQFHLARLAQQTQSLDGGHHFHAIVRGGGLEAANFTPMRSVEKHRAPAAWPRIARARSIGINRHAFDRFHRL